MQNIIKILFWVTGTLVLTFLCKNVQYFLKNVKSVKREKNFKKRQKTFYIYGLERRSIREHTVKMSYAYVSFHLRRHSSV